jgi:hypothetical protein
VLRLSLHGRALQLRQLREVIRYPHLTLLEVTLRQ